MSASTNLLELPSTQDSLSQFITNLGNSANVLAEVLTRQAHSISQTGRVDEALMVSLVCLQNLLGQFQYLVASGQEAVVQKQSFKLEIEQHVTKQLEQISKKMEETAKDEIKKVSEQSKNQIEVLSKKMTEQSKGEIMKMGENTSKTINKYTENMSDQICNLDYTADTIQDDLRAIKEAIDDSKEYHKEAVAHANTAKEAAVLTINELQLAAEDLKRERLLFQDQHDRLENKINQMQRVLEGKEEEVKGLKAIYSKLSSCSTRLVQSAGAFREVQYKFLVDAAAKLDQKMARIAHHVAYTSPMAGKKAPAAAPTNGTPKADRVVQEGDSDVEPEDKVAELKRMVAELKYTNDVLTNKNALLELRVAKFEHEQRQQQQGALAPQPSAAPAVPPPPPPQLGPGEVPETPCQTLRSVRSRRSLRAAESVGESLAGLTLSEPNDSDKTTIVRPVVSVGSLVQPDLWERLLAPALLSDEIKRRIRLVKPQVAGGLRMEDVFLRVVNIAVHDECWNEFDQYLKHGGDDWHCVKRMVNNGWTTSRILPGNNCEHGKECLWVKRTSVDYGKVIFKPNAM
ncbi:hypothetical protein B0T20DRAFT_446323 [Sordaria brevicollis]|uniref:Uncharacterized protein n=1 Tax=Sordaria brevicollis TaxID=83679 RepID=A0AAE0P104_SORBR|nr:hypothetical protein B0T20DRAFT_446323 [Sordaria brevicollis]